MAISQVDYDAPSGLIRYKNTASNNTKSGVKSSSGNLYALIVDNTLNAAVSYVKLWDLASGSVTVGTTAPDFIFYIPASTKLTIILPETIALANGLTESTVTTAGTAGTTSPSSNVALTILYT
jgi:hypothetical protein